MTIRPHLAVAALAVVTVAGCGSDDDEAAVATDAPAMTTAATVAPATTPAATLPATTVPVTTVPETSAAETTVAGTTAGPGLSDEESAAADVYRTVFDSSLPADDKVALIEDGEALRPTIESYAAAGDAVGGIVLEPSAVTIDGSTAAVVYDVLFAGTPVYQDLDGSLVDDGGWKVTREEFCDFMAQARNPCP
jgi:iron complex transport system substrate-binding protein